MTAKCPSCGVGELSVAQSTRSVRAPFGQPVPFVVTISTCSTCGADLDLDDGNDKRAAEAMRESVRGSIPGLYAFIAATGRRDAYIERAVGLPKRTSNRWKNKQLSSSALALLRMLRTFPWLIEVAAAGFDARIADKELIKAAHLALKGVRPGDSRDEQPNTINAQWRGRQASAPAFTVATSASATS